ncbi:hypothetical protein NDU88_005546 [Pleurodeles waltl]|uniref:Uncharacterized protein n=1 Tax=Pleurodeles waltl TaxID=8319 RepID=A0AAV7W9U8_PLEWA|nr:hypothetical protein NDU88_005546 [Pleurodeles waltl]
MTSNQPRFGRSLDDGGRAGSPTLGQDDAPPVWANQLRASGDAVWLGLLVKVFACFYGSGQEPTPFREAAGAVNEKINTATLAANFPQL